MNASTEQLMKVMAVFCKEFDITPPQSNSIREWWKDALQQMDEEVVEILHQTFAEGGSNVLRGMREDLVTRRNELVLAV